MFGRRKKRPDPGEIEARVIKDPDRARERTMNRAVRLLAAKPRAVLELRERLLEKSWTSAAIVDDILEKLKEYKYLDDEQYARNLAAAKLRQKPQGRRRLRQSMSQKRLDKEIVKGAIDEAFEKMPEEGLIDEAIAKRVRLKGVPETREDKKRFYDHLLRRGFAFDLIREKMKTIASVEIEDRENYPQDNG